MGEHRERGAAESVCPRERDRQYRARPGIAMIVKTGHAVTVSGMDGTPLPGDFLLTTIDQPIVNALVRIGQALSGDWSRWTHAALYVGGPQRCVIEMAPGGIKVRHLGEFAGRAAAGKLAFSSWDLTDGQRAAIVARAWELQQARPPKRYGWLTFPAMALIRLGIRPAWLLAYLARGAEFQCAQFVDEDYRAGGVQMFADERPFRLVSPGDLTYTMSSPKRLPDV